MAVTAKGGIYTTPYKGEIPMRPGDMVLEVLRETAAASAISLTMLTDTAKIGWASVGAPVNRTAGPGGVGVGGRRSGLGDHVGGGAGDVEPGSGRDHGGVGRCGSESAF